MSSRSTATSAGRTTGTPKKSELPASDVQQFRRLLKEFLSVTDDQGRKWADAKWGVYAFYDYDGEPIYVGQTTEKLRVRLGRHLTNQRTDAAAMRILDLFEVASVEIWPFWQYETVNLRAKTAPAYIEAKATLDGAEYGAYLDAIENSRFKAILNEKIPPLPKPDAEPVQLPASLRRDLITPEIRNDRSHPDIRIARRAETISRLAAVARERGEVSEGLRRVLVIQAVRLAYISAVRLAYAEGRNEPSPDAIDVNALVGTVLYETSDPGGTITDPNDASLDPGATSDPDPDAAS